MVKRLISKGRAKSPKPAAAPEAPAAVHDTHERTWTAIPRVSAPSKKHAFFLVLSGPQIGSIFPLEVGRARIIGRRDDADVVIRDDGVSRRHASVKVEGEGALLMDLESANGTWVDGKPSREARLVDGSRVHVGRQTTLKFIWADDLEARYQRQLAAGAQQDPLTGLYNRRLLEDRLGSELAAAQRHGRAMSFMMIDVDRFKEVNDRHGHLAGDEALKMVADALRETVRKEDVVARFGGEEFVVIARETGLDGGKRLAERIRRAVEKRRCAWQGRELNVTVSIGVTVSVGLAAFQTGRTERELMDAADKALYLAKHGGRNRVVAVELGAKGSASGSR
jgi:two-component system, cell cycle response regulator